MYKYTAQGDFIVKTTLKTGNYNIKETFANCPLGGQRERGCTCSYSTQCISNKCINKKCN